MTTRRLLFGGGAFPVPALAAEHLTASPLGGGVVSSRPKACYAYGRTHVTWINGSTGAFEGATLDHTTGSVSSPATIGDTGSPETHRLGAILVRSQDRRIVAVYGGHVEGFLYRAISPSANTIAGTWPAGTDLDASLGGTLYQFPTLVQLNGVTDAPIYLFYEDRVGGLSGTSRLCYSISTDGGATFGAQRVLFSRASSTFPAWQIGTDSDSRIDIVIQPTDGYSTAASLYHLWIDGTDESHHASDGSAISGIPFDTGSLTLVYDGSGDGTFPGATVVVEGKPVTVFYTKVDGTHNAIKRAAWDGAVWNVETVLASAGVHPADRFSTGLTVLEDGETIYLGDLVSGVNEIFRYRPAGGGSWSGTQITTGSPAHNCQVEAVVNGHRTFPAAWYQGTLTDSTTFALRTDGLVAA